jgi:choline dehydrogenase-like flavoprotein
LVLAEFEREIKGYQGDPIAAYCHEFFHGRATDRGFILEPIFVHPMMFSMLMPGFGAAHQEGMTNYNRIAMCIVQVHDESKGRVASGLGGRPLVRYRLGEADRERAMSGLKAAIQIYFAAGARRVMLPYVKPTVLTHASQAPVVDAMGVPALGAIFYSAHPQGGVAMGENREKCAVDSHGLHPSVKNLIVCDAGSFPTSVGVNPMLSVMAMADRVGRYWKAAMPRAA